MTSERYIPAHPIRHLGPYVEEDHSPIPIQTVCVVRYPHPHPHRFLGVQHNPLSFLVRTSPWASLGRNAICRLLTGPPPFLDNAYPEMACAPRSHRWYPVRSWYWQPDQLMPLNEVADALPPTNLNFAGAEASNLKDAFVRLLHYTQAMHKLLQQHNLHTYFLPLVDYVSNGDPARDMDILVSQRPNTRQRLIHCHDCVIRHYIRMLGWCRHVQAVVHRLHIENPTFGELQTQIDSIAHKSLWEQPNPHRPFSLYPFLAFSEGIIRASLGCVFSNTSHPPHVIKILNSQPPCFDLVIQTQDQAVASPPSPNYALVYSSEPLPLVQQPDLIRIMDTQSTETRPYYREWHSSFETPPATSQPAPNPSICECHFSSSYRQSSSSTLIAAIEAQIHGVLQAFTDRVVREADTSVRLAETEREQAEIDQLERALVHDSIANLYSETRELKTMACDVKTMVAKLLTAGPSPSPSPSPWPGVPPSTSSAPYHPPPIRFSFLSSSNIHAAVVTSGPSFHPTPQPNRPMNKYLKFDKPKDANRGQHPYPTSQDARSSGPHSIHPPHLWTLAYAWANDMEPALADTWRCIVRHSVHHLAEEPFPTGPLRVSAAFKYWLERFHRRFPGIQQKGRSLVATPNIPWYTPLNLPTAMSEAEANTPSEEEFLEFVRLWRYGFHSLPPRLGYEFTPLPSRTKPDST